MRVSADDSDQTIDLSKKFPQMKPIKSAPTMFTYNGIGTALYGGRDPDDETGTYVKTQCATVIFVPLFALGAYRVANAEGGGWYFIGKEPLSGLAKGFNALSVFAILAVIVGVNYSIYTGTEAYQSQQRLARADAQVESGDVAGASKLYVDLAVGSSQSDAARQRLSDLIERVHELPPNQVDHVFDAAALVHRRTHSPVRDDVVDRAIAFAGRSLGTDPEAALATLGAVEAIATDEQYEAMAAARMPVLEKMVEKDPKNVAAVSQLAVAYEATGAWDEARELLVPKAVLLGDSDGARVLGQIYAAEGDYDMAYKLLQPYAKKRLEALHAAEAEYDATLDRMWQREIRTLENSGPESWWRKYNAASETEQARMVNDYIWGKIENSPGLLAAREKMMDAGAVVPVAMDLGMVMLRRAQGMNDPELRTAHLKDAEDVFLGIQSFAGDSQGYQLYLAQVKHWLGKRDESRAMLDKMLADSERSYATLLSVGTTLRSLGSESGARELYEEAYEKASTDPEKYHAARTRALVYTDLDDEIAWLEKSDPKDTDTRATLERDRGIKARNEGDDEKAAEHYRKALAIYESMPEGSNKLNSMAIVLSALHTVTGDTAVFDRSLQLFESALKLQPEDTILMQNYAASLMERAALDVMGDRIDFRSLKSPAQLSMVRWFYTDEAGLLRESKHVAGNRYAQRAVDLYEQLLILRGDSSLMYSVLGGHYRLVRDEKALARLRGQLDQAEPDLADRRTAALEYYEGANREELIEGIHDALSRWRKRLEGRESDTSMAATLLRAKLLEAILNAQSEGLEADLDEALALARRIHADAPSVMSAHHLGTVHVVRASVAVAGKSSEYAELRDRTKRTLSALYRLILAGERSPAMRRVILDDPEFQAALALQRQTIERFPRMHSPVEWALIRMVDPDAAEPIAQVVRGYHLDAHSSAIDLRLNPLALGYAIDAYWRKLAEGKSEAEAMGAIRAAVDAGAPAPFKLD